MDIGLISKVIPLKLFLDMVSRPPAVIYHARLVEVLVEDENARKAAWTAVQVTKIRVTTLTISRPSWNFLSR